MVIRKTSTVDHHILQLNQQINQHKKAIQKKMTQASNLRIVGEDVGSVEKRILEKIVAEDKSRPIHNASESDGSWRYVPIESAREKYNLVEDDIATYALKKLNII